MSFFEEKFKKREEEFYNVEIGVGNLIIKEMMQSLEIPYKMNCNSYANAVKMSKSISEIYTEELNKMIKNQSVHVCEGYKTGRITLNGKSESRQGGYPWKGYISIDRIFKKEEEFPNRIIATTMENFPGHVIFRSQIFVYLKSKWELLYPRVEEQWIEGKLFKNEIIESIWADESNKLEVPCIEHLTVIEITVRQKGIYTVYFPITESTNDISTQ